MKYKNCLWVVLFMLLSLSCEIKSPQPNYTSPQQKLIVGASIDQVENGLIALRRALDSTYQTLPQKKRDGIKLNELLMSLDLVSVNQQHPLRNFIDAIQKPGYVEEIMNQQDYFFYIWQRELPLIGIPDLEKNLLAGYMLSKRILVLPDSLDMGSVFDQLFIYHETVHALQDAQIRNSYTTHKEGLNEYYNFFNKDQANWFPGFEFGAFQFQISALWLLTQGAVEVPARQGKLTVEWLTKELKCSFPTSHTSRRAVETLCTLTNYYYQWGIDTKGIDPKFMQQLMYAYDHQNRHAYFFDYDTAQFISAD